MYVDITERFGFIEQITHMNRSSRMNEWMAFRSKDWLKMSNLIGKNHFQSVFIIEQSIFSRLKLIFPIKKARNKITCQKLIKMKDTTATSVKRLYDERHMRWHNSIAKTFLRANRGDADSWLLKAICGFKYQRGWLCRSEAAATASYVGPLRC